MREWSSFSIAIFAHLVVTVLVIICVTVLTAQEILTPTVAAPIYASALGFTGGILAHHMTRTKSTDDKD